MTFSREAVKFFSKAVKFSRAAVTFFGRNSHQPRQNSFYDLSHHACKYIIVITVNEPSPLAPLTPALGAGGVGGVGCFLLVPIIIRARAAAGATAAWLSHRKAGTYTDGTPVGASPHSDPLKRPGSRNSLLDILRQTDIFLRDTA